MRSPTLDYVIILHHPYSSIDTTAAWKKLNFILSARSSKQQSCRYYYMDAPLGRKLNRWRKSLTVTTQECCEQYWISPGGNTPQSGCCTATYHPSRKLSKLDKPDMQEKQGQAHMWCSPSKSKATSSNLHTAALWGYGM